MSSPTIAVLLAAGAGSRFDGDGHKLDADLNGATVAEHAVRAALDADIGTAIVVTGAVAPSLPSLRAEVADGAISFVANPNWAEGQSTSLRSAVDIARARHAHAMVVGLADQPFVTAEDWRAVGASRSPIAVAEYDGRSRPPVRLHHSVWPLLPITGDHGARHLIRLRPQLVERVPCQGSDADIDTLEDLRSWQNKSSTNSP